MKVLLAGYNVDAEVLEELKRQAPPRDDVTPETLSASYARLSRDPRPVDELRRAAREEVERARRSNRTIIFKMGHHSVAEHAVFNFDVIGISRLAIEELERFRLSSFTEKSQRYITLEDDFVIPEEIKKAGLEESFVTAVHAQNALYKSLFSRLREYFFDRYRDRTGNPMNHPILEGWAKEDARYVVCLATQGQLGMTVNARNLELLIRRFAAKDLAELRELNLALYALAKAVAPSIVLFTEPTDFDVRARREFAEAAAGLFGENDDGSGGEDVRLVGSTPDGDLKVLAALLHAVSGRPYDLCLSSAERSTVEQKRELFKSLFRYMEFYDSPVREFEHAALTYDLTVSASCFAQLKRHRMATLTWQPYDPELGVTVPPSVREAGAEREFMENAEKTHSLHSVLKSAAGPAADYILTNGHRRRVLLKTSVRELYHIARLRLDATAQWEIRGVAAKMSDLAKRAFPLSCLLIGGKDAYPDLYREIFGREPSLLPPAFWHTEES